MFQVGRTRFWVQLLMLVCLLLLHNQLFSQTIYDSPECDIRALFSKDNAKYIIRYNHVFRDTLYIPDNCELRFRGGSMAGPLVFNSTKLSGGVNLKGSSIKGVIKNKKFDASWLCEKDGVTDDAKSINEIIAVCSSVYFPKGTYRLISEYNPKGKVPKGYESSIKAHIGINKSNVSLIGEDGCFFATNEETGTICCFSQPKAIDNSIKNLRIENITFTTDNDGKNYLGMTHTLKLIGVDGMHIKDCTFDNYWGDAICLSHYGDTPSTGERTLNQNFVITGNTIRGRGYNRNGISIVSGKNILIKNNKLINTSRDDKPGGIDIEPNNSAYTIENIRIEKNTLKDIQGSGGAICIVVDNDGPAHGIYVVGNTISNSRNGLFIRVYTDNTTDNFVIKNNTFDSKTPPFFFSGSGTSNNWVVRGNVFKKPNKKTIPGDIKVDNLEVRRNKSGILMPILIWGKSVWDTFVSFFATDFKKW